MDIKVQAENAENVAAVATSQAMTTEREMTVCQSLRFWPKAIGFSLVISLAIIMEVCVPVPVCQSLLAGADLVNRS